VWQSSHSVKVRSGATDVIHAVIDAT